MKISLYRAMPGPLRGLARRAYALLPMRARMGKGYWETRTFLEDAAGWDAERIGLWQLSQLRALVRSAQRDRERGRPEAQRKLFRFLREILDAGPLDDSGDEPREDTEPRPE